MDLSQPILVTAATPQVDQILSSITYLHAHCIMHDHTLATFLPPLSHSVMLEWWRARLAEVTATNRHIVAYLMPVGSRTANIPPPAFSDVPAGTLAPIVVFPGNSGDVSYEVASVVMLDKPVTQTGPFRGGVEKMFTSPNHRRKGLARAVMKKLEEAALKDGRWNLILDTIMDSEAELMYPRLGYQRVGVVEDFGYSPEDGRLVHDVWFFKNLNKHKRL